MLLMIGNMKMFRNFAPGMVYFCVCFILGSSVALEIEEINDDLKVAISLGAEISPVDDVILYTSTEYLYFVLPDVPNPPTVSHSNCENTNGQLKDACKMYQGLQQGVKDISDLLVVHNRILTTRGLKSSESGGETNTITVSPSWLKSIDGVDVSSNRPTEDMISEAGNPWFNETETQLILRSFISSPNAPLNFRAKRWAGAVKPLLNLATGVVRDQIPDIFDKLFVGDNSIISHLTGSRLMAKKDYEFFTTLPKKVSELQTETKRLFLEVLKSTELSKKMAEKLEGSALQQDLKFATIEQSFLLEQRTLGDLIRQVYTTNVYGVHFNAFEECRNSLMPTAFIPPDLLRERLVQIQKKLPDNIKLAIPPSAIQRYYKLPLAECVYDSNGGLARVAVPMVETDATFRLYAFKALHFSHGDMTCSLETGASFVVKDLKNLRAYSITDLDKQNCNVEKNGLCRIPMASSDDSSNFCVSVLLSEQPAYKIKEACKLQCFHDARPSVSQIRNNVFIGNHLPQSGVSMECKDKIYNLNSIVPHGAVKFEGSCGCKIKHGSKILGEVSSKSCSMNEVPKITTILPLQMTNLQDLLPFSIDSKESTMYDHSTEVYNPKFQSTEDVPVPSPNYTWILSVASWNFLHMMLITYILMRINQVTRAIGALRARLPRNAMHMPIMALFLPGVFAHSVHECQLPADAYAILLAILGVCLMGVVPSLGMKVLAHIRGMANNLIENAAQRIAFEEEADA